jgi:hypothetical protein
VITTKALSFVRKLIYAIGHDPQGINIQARICFIKDGKCGFKDGHLEDLVFLFLSTGEAFIH